MEFQFHTPEKILFGAGTLAQLPEALAGWGNHPLLVTGASAAYADPVRELLGPVPEWRITGELSLPMLEEGLQTVNGRNVDHLVAVGGGSVIDAAKAVAALATNPGNPLDYFEVVGSGKPLSRPSLPVAALPTTAGTGAEATMNAVIGVPQHRRKVSLRHPFLLPKLALVDPELALNLPPEITATTGMDALVQLIEGFLSTRATPLTDALCREMLPKMLPALWAAVREGAGVEVRSELALGALSSGLVLANGGLGAVHGLAGPLGGALGLPHGWLCARLVVPVLTLSLDRLEVAGENWDGLERFDELGYLLTGLPEAVGRDVLANLQQLVDGLPLAGVPDTIDTESFPALCEAATTSSSMRGNPVPLSATELLEAVSNAMEEA